MIDIYSLIVIALVVQIFHTISSVLLLCMIYQLNKNQQERARRVEIRADNVADKVEAVKDRLVITTGAEAKDQTIRELKV